MASITARTGQPFSTTWQTVHLSQCALSAGLAPSVSCGTGSLFGRPPISEGNLTRKPSGVAWPTVLRMRV